MRPALFLSTLGFAASAAVAAPPSGPSHLEIANLAQGSEALTVKICAEGGACLDRRIGSKTVSELPPLTAGTYRFAVSANRRVIERFRYGIGSGGHFSLALYGIVAPPRRIGLWARMKRLLGGSDEPVTAGYQFAHRMFTLDPGRPGDPAAVRLVNLAPGGARISARLDWRTGSQSLGPVRFAAPSKTARAPQPSARMTLMFAGSPVALASRSLDLPAGSATIVYVAEAGADTVRTVIAREQRR